MSSRRSRLATLLGDDLSDLTAEHVHRLVDNAVREDVDLDFKEPLYGNGESEKRDLAGDVAALANTLGGALILGVKDEDGTAAADPGVALSDAEEVRMHLILASNIAPHVGGVRIHRVERSEGEGFYVIEVPRSPDMPHAVRVGSALRYPRRLGTTIHWLSETEVADAYRNRFAAAAAQVDRLTSVYDAGLAGLSKNGWAGETAWLSVALLPDLPGELPLTHHVPRQVAQELRNRAHPIAGRHSLICGYDTQEGVGVRRVTVTQGAYDTKPPKASYWELHSNGAGFGALALGGLLRDQSVTGQLEVLEPPRFGIPDEDLVIDLAQIIDALVEHAVDRCGTSGLGVVRAGIEARSSDSGTLPCLLVHSRSRVPFPLRFADAPLTNDIPTSDHTVDLDGIESSKLAIKP